MGRASRHSLRMALICGPSLLHLLALPQKAAIVHESYPGRLWSLPSLRTGAPAPPSQSSAADLLHLALGKAKARRPPALTRQLLSLPPYAGLSAQPHPFLFAPDVIEDGLLEHAAFDRWTKRIIAPCDAFIAISGAGLLTGRKVQANGGIFICDRGSTHQRYQEEVIAEEYRRWNVPQPLSKPHITIREEEIYATADAITVPSTVARRSFLADGHRSREGPRHPLRRAPRSVHPHRSTAAGLLSRSSSPVRSAFAKVSPISFKPSPASTTRTSTSPSSAPFRTISAAFSPRCPPKT